MISFSLNNFEVALIGSLLVMIQLKAQNLKCVYFCTTKGDPCLYLKIFLKNFLNYIIVNAKQHLAVVSNAEK